MPKLCVVVSATHSTGHRNTFGGTDCWQVTAKQKQMQKGAPLCHSRLFSPGLVYVLQRMKAVRRVGGAEPPHLAGLAALRAECGLIRKHRVDPHSGVRACEQRSGSETQQRASNQPLQTPGAGCLPAPSPNCSRFRFLPWAGVTGALDQPMCALAVLTGAAGELGHWAGAGGSGGGQARAVLGVAPGVSGTVSCCLFSAVFARCGVPFVP